MDCQLYFKDYADTGYYSPLIIDFLREDKKLRPFYRYSPNHPDFTQAIEARKNFAIDRPLLVNELKGQYAGIPLTEKVAGNIELLLQENTFTICTAHQPNLFTGYLYFVYKIVQAIKLAEQLQQQYPTYHFVPVYYMGSEDNDLQELSVINMGGKQLQWHTAQQGAVGRMRPEGLEALIGEIGDTIGTGEYAQKMIALLKEAYLQHDDIQTATLYLVNALFGEYGLVVLIPDTPAFKRAIALVIREELLQQSSFPIVSQTIQALSQHYHAQASPREINLFYLKDQLRERIVKEGAYWKVLNTDIRFDQSQLEKEVDDHPERFSPNVILRGILQESILPDIAFIGGGGEIAYWLELQALFEHHKVPFPVLLLRNSLLWVNEQAYKKIQRISIAPPDLFSDAEALIRQYVQQHTQQQLDVESEREAVTALFLQLNKRAAAIDPTLTASVAAEQVKVLRSLDKLALKFMRGEKKKYTIQSRQIHTVKAALFPGHNLQERVENLIPFYAAYGDAFIQTIYQSIDPLCNRFTILAIKDKA